MQAPEPQFTSTRFAPLATAMELVLPEKFTPWSSRRTRQQIHTAHNQRKLTESFTPVPGVPSVEG